MTKGNLIIGAGGHGKVIADAMLCQTMNILGFLDDNPSFIGQHVLEIPILGKAAQWVEFKPDGLIVGIGNNATRRAIVSLSSKDAAPPWITVLHPNATVANSVQIGMGTVIMAGAVVNPDTILGEHTIINTGATVDHDCVIGNFVHIAPGVHLAGGVRVGDDALLGIGCSVILGCTIGDGTVIGAGAAVVCDVPPGVIAKGIPARWEKPSS